MVQRRGVQIAELRPAFLSAMKAFGRKAHTIKNNRWALNFHQEVHPEICWEVQEILRWVEAQRLKPSVKALLWDRLRVIYAWGNPWVRGHYPGSPRLPELPWVPYTYWSQGKRRKRRKIG